MSDLSVWSDAYRIANMYASGKKSEMEYKKKLRDFYIDLIKNKSDLIDENTRIYFNYKIDDVFVIDNLKTVLEMIGCAYISKHGRIDRISFQLPENWEKIANKISDYPKCIISIL